MWREADVHVHPERIRDRELQEAHAKGLVCRSLLSRHERDSGTDRT